MADLALHRNQLALHVPPEGLPINPTGACQAVDYLSKDIPYVSVGMRALNHGWNRLFTDLANMDQRATGWIEETPVPDSLQPFAKWGFRVPLIALAIGGLAFLNLATRGALIRLASTATPIEPVTGGWIKQFLQGASYFKSATMPLWIAAFLTTTNIVAGTPEFLKVIDPDYERINGGERKIIQVGLALLVAGVSLFILAGRGEYGSMVSLPVKLAKPGIDAFKSAWPRLGKFIRSVVNSEGQETEFFLSRAATAGILAGWFGYIAYWNTVRTQERNLEGLDGMSPGAGRWPANWKPSYHNLQPAVSEVAVWAGFASVWGSVLFQWGQGITSLVTRHIFRLGYGVEVLNGVAIMPRVIFSIIDLPIGIALAVAGLQASQIARNYGSESAVSFTSNRSLFTMSGMIFFKNVVLAKWGFIPSILLYSTTMWINHVWAACTEADQTLYQNAIYSQDLYRSATAAGDEQDRVKYAVELFNQHRLAVNSLPSGLEPFAEEWNQFLYPDYLAIRQAKEK